MENDGDILQRTSLHLCSGVRVGGEWQPLFPRVFCRASCHTVPLPDLGQALGCPQGEQSHLPKISICLFWI